VEGQVFWPGEVSRREHLLVVEPVGRFAVELFRSGLGGHHLLHSGRPAVFARICIDLDGALLDRFGIRGEIEDALPDAAGDVESVDDEHVRHLTLAVGAGIHLRLGRVVVDAGAGRAGFAGLAAAHRPKAGDSWSQGGQCDHIAPGYRQLADGIVFECQLVPTIDGVDNRRLGGDRDRLGGGTHGQFDRDTQVLFGK
jgi:hypothetical protein